MEHEIINRFLFLIPFFVQLIFHKRIQGTNQTEPRSKLVRFKHSYNYGIKNCRLGRIRTRIVGVDNEHADF